ncbi:MAG: helix-turn-helix transcriptional regulator [Firmicutes bacterium]|nr:helix-turn-helix transcriptional regulator [Bacillota bacterium]
MRYSKLRGLMAEKNISQKQLATEIGLNESTLNAKLAGKAKFRADEIVAIASKFDIFGHIEEYFFCDDTCENHKKSVGTS